MTTIVAEFGKFRYNCLPTGMCPSGDIFRAKVDKLLGDIEVVKKYSDDILLFRKDLFRKNIEYPIIIFVRLGAAGLKDNASK